MLIGLNLDEKIKYSELDDDLKHELLEVIDNQVDKDLVESEIEESKLCVYDLLEHINKAKSLLSTDCKNKQHIIDDIQEALIELEDFESGLTNAIEYHHEKIDSSKDILNGVE